MNPYTLPTHLPTINNQAVFPSFRRLFCLASFFLPLSSSTIVPRAVFCHYNLPPSPAAQGFGGVGGGRKRLPFRRWMANCSWVSLLPPGVPPFPSGRTRGALKATRHFVQCSWKQAFHTWSLSRQPRSTPFKPLNCQLLQLAPCESPLCQPAPWRWQSMRNERVLLLPGPMRVKYPQITGFLVVNRPWLAPVGGMRRNLLALFENERCNFPCILCPKKKKMIKIKRYPRYPRKQSSPLCLPHWESGWGRGRVSRAHLSKRSGLPAFCFCFCFSLVWKKKSKRCANSQS